MLYHIIATLIGFILDLILGDPYNLPHPIRLIGAWIHMLEGWLIGKKDQKQVAKGIFLVLLVLLLTALLSGVCLWIAYYLHPVAGCLIEGIMTYQILAMRCLKDESMKVYRRLQENDLKAARAAVSMIVGRDTIALDRAGVIRATVETVAENTSDGVIAPLLYTALGGPVLGFLYKAVNTMDSMIGYQNGKYLYFGRAAAKLDDLMNYIPARVSAWLIILACRIGGRDYDSHQAWKIWKRDRYQHASPNSAQTEAACAGALGIRLAGDASYFGELVKKPYIGDDDREVENEDIVRVNKLMYLAAFLCEAACLILLGGIAIWRM